MNISYHTVLLIFEIARNEFIYTLILLAGDLHASDQVLSYLTKLLNQVAEPGTIARWLDDMLQCKITKAVDFKISISLICILY